MLQLVPQHNLLSQVSFFRTVCKIDSTNRIRLSTKYIFLLYEKKKKGEKKLYEGMGISFKVMPNIFEFLCFHHMGDGAFPSWTGHQQVNCSHVKRWPKARAHGITTIFIHTTKPVPFLAGQPNPSFLNKKDLHQTAQVGVKQGTLFPKLLILYILQRLPSC